MVVIPVVLVALGLTGWQLRAASKAEAEDPFKALGIQKLKDRPKTPPFALPDVNANSVRLADFKGKVVLLNFFCDLVHALPVGDARDGASVSDIQRAGLYRRRNLH